MSSDHPNDLNLSALNGSTRIELSEKIKNLYKTCFFDVKNFVVANSGSIDDARDIFQEAILVYVKQISDPEFKLTSTEKNYLMGISRNMWLKNLRDKKTVNMGDDDWIIRIEEKTEQEYVELIEKDFLMDLVSKKLNEISKECRDLIFHAFYMKRSATEIAELCGYTEQFVKVKKFRCLQGLKKLITSSDDYKNVH